MTELTAYKAFNADMTCRGFQYEVGETYEHDGKISLCSSGFHACELPFDCWGYYSNSTTFARVRLSGVSDERRDDSKVVASRITIEERLSMPEWIGAHVNALGAYIRRKIDATTGYAARAATTGYAAHAATTGYAAHAATTGDDAHAATTGYAAHAATTGYAAHAATTGKNSIAAGLGIKSTATAGDGGWIVLARHDDDFNVAEIRSAKVGTEGVEAGKTYRLTADGFQDVEG